MPSTPETAELIVLRRKSRLTGWLALGWRVGAMVGLLALLAGVGAGEQQQVGEAQVGGEAPGGHQALQVPDYPNQCVGARFHARHPLPRQTFPHSQCD